MCVCVCVCVYVCACVCVCVCVYGLCKYVHTYVHTPLHCKNTVNRHTLPSITRSNDSLTGPFPTLPPLLPAGQQAAGCSAFLRISPNFLKEEIGIKLDIETGKEDHCYTKVCVCVCVCVHLCVCVSRNMRYYWSDFVGPEKE